MPKLLGGYAHQALFKERQPRWALSFASRPVAVVVGGIVPTAMLYYWRWRWWWWWWKEGALLGGYLHVYGTCKMAVTSTRSQGASCVPPYYLPYLGRYNLEWSSCHLFLGTSTLTEHREQPESIPRHQECHPPRVRIKHCRAPLT